MQLDKLKSTLQEISNSSFEANLTISFSGYNILPNLKLAIGSFLKLYPHLKSMIVVFDDDSTDGTREWLESENIKRISWSQKYKTIVDNNYRGKKGIKDCNISLIYLVGCLMNDIMEQTKTKYLLMNDGDVVFLYPFLNMYNAIVNNGYKVAACISSQGAEMWNDSRYESYKNNFPEYSRLLRDDDNLFMRAHQYHGLYDLEYLKSIGILHDRVENKLVQLMQNNPLGTFSNPIIDTGVDFLAQLYAKNVPVYDLQYSNNVTYDPVFHFGFVASQNKMKSFGRNIGNDVRHDKLINKFNHSHIKTVIHSIDPDFKCDF